MSQHKIDIFLTVTFYTSDPLLLQYQSFKKVLITTYKAPPEGDGIPKANESSILIYKGPEVKLLQVGIY